jgi:hypothetical protein
MKSYMTTLHFMEYPIKPDFRKLDNKNRINKFQHRGWNAFPCRRRHSLTKIYHDKDKASKSNYRHKMKKNITNLLLGNLYGTIEPSKYTGKWYW